MIMRRITVGVDEDRIVHPRPGNNLMVQHYLGDMLQRSVGHIQTGRDILVRELDIQLDCTHLG